MTEDATKHGRWWPTSRALDAADRLCLAATPAFAVMALATGPLGGVEGMLCAPGGGGSPLAGMAWMYLLMSAFHAAPWLKLIGRRRLRLRD